MRQTAAAALALCVCLVSAGHLAADDGGKAFPALKVEGGFENAQTHATGVQNPTGAEPTVIIGGTVKRLEHQAVATRHPHKYYHYHLRLTQTAGRTVRFRYGPLAGSDPHVSCLKTPVVYYEADPARRRYELVRDVGAEVVFLGERDADRAKNEYWGSVVTFRHRFRKETAYLCQSFPLTNDDVARLAGEAKRHGHATAVELGRSKYDKIPLVQIVVTDPAVPDARKKGVWLHAGEDPWEFPGMIACAGAARWAMSDDPLAAEFRRKFVLYCLPICHPDCVRRGWTNYSLDEGYTNFINFGWSYDRTDVPEHDLMVARVSALKEAGRPIDYGESMHSSISWGSFIRFQYRDEAESKRFVTEFFSAKYVPWNAWHTYRNPEKNRERFTDITENKGLVARMRGPYPTVQYHVSHTEAVLFPIKELPGFPVPPFPAWGRKAWTEEDSLNMRGQMIPHRVEDIEAWGVYRLLALMEYHGTAVDPAHLRPQLMCGLVDRYAGKPGQARTFAVLYRDMKSRPPKRVTLHLADGSQHEMQRDCGTSPLHAIRFKAAVPIEPGKDYDFHFTATNGATKVRYPRTGSFLGPYASDSL